MTFARIVETGNGAYSFRLRIPGVLQQWVSDDSLSGMGTPGLEISGFTINERISLKDSALDVDGYNVSIIDVGELTTATFGGLPTASTVLTANATVSATTLTVQSTTAFPSSGYVHIGTEAIAYSGKTSTTFTGCTRGSLGTYAQAHYLVGAESVHSRAPEVTNTPVCMEGRRAELYIYGEGDDVMGDGTMVHRGVLTRDARFDGATKWGLRVESLMRTLDVEMGSNLDDGGMTPRGIYYPYDRPLFVNAQESTTVATFSGGTTFNTCRFAMSGFFETQEDFLAELNLRIITETSGWEGSLRAVPDGSSWTMQLVTSATPRWVTMHVTSPIDDDYNGGQSAYQWFQTFDGNQVYGQLYENTSYLPSRTRVIEGAGTVPRGFVGIVSSETTDYRDPDGITTAGAGRLYVSADLPSGISDYVQIKFGEEILDGTFGVDDDGLSYVQLYHGEVIYTAQSIPDIALIYDIVRTSLSDSEARSSAADFLEALFDVSPSECNRGFLPLVPEAEWAPIADIRATIEAAAGGSAFVTQRSYASGAGMKLGDFLREELKAVGCYLATDNIGGAEVFTVKRLDVIVPTSTPDATIDANDELRSRALASWERNGEGVVNTVIYRTGYDPVEDDFFGPQYVLRDMSALSRNKTTGTVEIAPMSRFDGIIDPADLIKLSQAIFGIYAQPYAVVRVPVPFTRFNVRLGQIVAYSSDLLPNNVGTRGISGALGRVVGRSWDFPNGFGTLTLMVTEARVAGYTPAGRVTGQSNITANTWDITLSSSPPAGHSTVSAFVIGDHVRVYRWNDATTTPASRAGTITGITGNIVTVDLNNTWTPGAATWNLGYATAGQVTSGTSQALWAYKADSTDGNISFSGSDSRARVYGA